MLYLFDLGNVIIDIDFKRAQAVWSNLSGIPLATITERFRMGTAFEQHERGEISDLEFAEQMSDELGTSLSFEQFSVGWQAIFVDARQEVIDIMHKLRSQGERVVILSNTNNLHCSWWPERYPQVIAAADRLYLSNELGMRKPEARIYQHVLDQENTTAARAVFFDDNHDNIASARALGIESIQVTNRQIIPAYFT